MRRLLIALGGLLCAGCLGPHSTGDLWALQELQRENAEFRVSETQRAAQAHAYQLSLADETLAAEQARLSTAMQACPSNPPRPLVLSTADGTRDTVRVQAAGDVRRLATLAQLALADWYLRRALASGQSDLCDRARQTLDASPANGQATAPLEQLGRATVARDPASAGPSVVASTPEEDLTALSLYACGVVDSVTATAPLPQYLAGVYGGSVTTIQAPSDANAGALSAEQRVDDLAPLYPQWEPDALYVTLRRG